LGSISEENFLKDPRDAKNKVGVSRKIAFGYAACVKLEGASSLFEKKILSLPQKDEKKYKNKYL